MIDWNNFQNKLQKRGEKAELSRMTGISTGNIRDWFNPNKSAQPGADALVKISKALGCSVDYLLGLTDIEYTVSSKSNIIPIPILEQKAAAGLGIETNDYSEYIREYRFFDKNEIPEETEFGIIIEGDSMEPTFKNGQVIFVKRINDCDINDYGIFCIIEDDRTVVVFKRKMASNDGSFYLHSLNPDRDDIGGFCETKVCRCVAKMVLKS